MVSNVSNKYDNVFSIKKQLENGIDNIDNVKKNTETNNNLMLDNRSRRRANEINERIERKEYQVYIENPKIREPKNKANYQYLTIELQKDKAVKKNNIINNSIFNFLSKEMINIINLMIDYLIAMIKKYESSRKLGNVFMLMQLSYANQIKDDLYKKADLVFSAAISSATVSMAIHGIGAFTSIKGLGKAKLSGETNNKIMIQGSFISSMADPVSKIVDSSIQNNALRMDGDIKVLENSIHAAGQLDSNNSEIQREALDIIKTLIQAMDAIIRANQDTASTISSNVRG
ncbi:type III secretion protein [Proteus faecis]|uniref:Type III secretion protein n=1 Tax=Proteus faecis TaxID=2050967 RepID=A0AAW7CS78_9GAMM|nr:type III secretion protein [Proteus faecis]MDO5404319.1 type III secretion protein [Proteus sp. (in: enterobacteria)]MDL5168047.1 type III secretion protein [Proteus faecis]MDL5276032.1 type III secretion protein [Proteus faecis]MDL5279599.1 type III secretion protein [Proteus faecis]MDL5308588.1 type III secretion protein [Proteus faecis]